MSTRFWMGSAALIGGATMLGFGIGSFATSVPPRDLSRYGSDSGAGAAEAPMMADGATVDTLDMGKGPEAIVCKGCGPTLAERRMVADNPGWDPDGMTGSGTRDPVVADYLAQQDDPAPPPVVPPSQVHRLPANIQRFADGEAKPQPVTPPPAVGRMTPAPSF